jgi:hypothetical protein
MNTGDIFTSNHNSRAVIPKNIVKYASPTNFKPIIEDEEYSNFFIKPFNFLVDSDCFICLDTVAPNCKYILCTGCKKVIHPNCYSKWSKTSPKTKYVCGYCQQTGFLTKHVNRPFFFKKIQRCLGYYEFNPI